MTAIAAIKRDDAIVMASDGAVYGPHGELIGLKSKVLTLPELACVIGQRGPVGFAEYLLGEIKADGIRDLMQKIEERSAPVWQEFRARYSATLPEHSRQKWSLVLGGYFPDRARFELWTIGSSERTLEGENGTAAMTAHPFKFEEIADGCFAAPRPAVDQYADFGISFESESLASNTEFVQRIVCAARARKFPSDYDGEPIHIAGGFLEVTILRAGEIEQKIVHEWPDPIGEKIDAARGEPMPTYLSAPPAS